MTSVTKGATPHPGNFCEVRIGLSSISLTLFWLWNQHMIDQFITRLLWNLSSTVSSHSIRTYFELWGVGHWGREHGFPWLERLRFIFLKIRTDGIWVTREFIKMACYVLVSGAAAHTQAKRPPVRPHYQTIPDAGVGLWLWVYDPLFMCLTCENYLHLSTLWLSMILVLKWKHIEKAHGDNSTVSFRLSLLPMRWSGDLKTHESNFRNSVLSEECVRNRHEMRTCKWR